MENAQSQSDFILIALLLSIGLHSTAIGFLPGFGKPPAPITPEPLTVELVTPEAPPPPPPIKEPEPVKPQPKPEPKPTPTPVSQPPKPAPVQKVLTPEPPPTSSPRNEPPPTPTAETAKPVEPSPQPVIAVEQKFNETPPTSIVPAQTPVAPQESDANHKAAIVGYGNQLTTEMSKNQNYPKRAKEKNWTGKGRILLKYDPKSKKFSYVISQTSGRAILDDDAKQNLQNALSSVPPTGLVADIPFEVEIPFIYRLEISQ